LNVDFYPTLNTVVSEALIALSTGDKNVKLPEQRNKHNNMHQLYNAVYTFKRSLEKNEEQQNRLNQSFYWGMCHQRSLFQLPSTQA
jgi:hypothetical protein